MTAIRTFCRVCEPACGLVATVEDGRLAAVRPDRDHPISRGWACNKGLATFDVHHDPDRLDRPLKRVAPGRFEPIGWDQAMAEIADRLRAIRAARGDQATALYSGNPTAFNALAGVGLRPFVAGLGTRQLYSSGTQDCSNKFAASEAVYGSSTVHPLPDFDHTDYLLVLGANPAVSHMSFVSIADLMRVLRAAQARGARLRFVNPRRVESLSGGLGELIRIRPDTDVWFLAALLHALDARGAFAADVLATRARHVDALRAFLAQYPAERVAPVTGIPAATVHRLAEEWASARGAAVTMSTGVNMGRHGTLAYWLVQMLSLCTGNLDRRGGNLQSVGYYPTATHAGAAGPPRFADGPCGPVRHVRGSLPGNLLADAIRAEGPEQVRALFVVAGNPLLSIGGEERLHAALAGLDLLVCVDLYRNATAELAHYVLPATDQFERADLTYAGLGLQHRPHVQYTDAVVAPRGERREEWWIFARLCRELGFAGPLDEGETPDVLARVARMLERGGLTLDQVRAAPGGLALPANQPGRLFDGLLPAPSGRVDCCPELLRGAFDGLAADFADRLAEPPGTLRLISKRDRFMHNSWFHNVAVLTGGT
ncbi:MAG: molybdopterin-dependent oxidoreductase [Candidatus Binatia bacterium]